MMITWHFFITQCAKSKEFAAKSQVIIGGDPLAQEPALRLIGTGSAFLRAWTGGAPQATI
jgi:hypothetical protein